MGQGSLGSDTHVLQNKPTNSRIINRLGFTKALQSALVLLLPVPLVAPFRMHSAN